MARIGRPKSGKTTVNRLNILMDQELVDNVENAKKLLAEKLQVPVDSLTNRVLFNAVISHYLRTS